MIHKKKPNSTSLHVPASQDEQETRRLEDRAFGVTIPLLLNSKGEKFGKSAGNAVWIDETMTTLFDFYQFFVKTADEDVERYLPLFTLLSPDEIKFLMHEHKVIFICVYESALRMACMLIQYNNISTAKSRKAYCPT